MHVHCNLTNMGHTCKCPLAPADGGAQSILCQVNCQGIGSHGCDEHGRRDAGCLKACLHQIGPHLLLSTISLHTEIDSLPLQVSTRHH